MPKVFCILVDPTQVQLQDIKELASNEFKGIPIIRTRMPYWGKMKVPIQLFTYDNSLIDIKNLEELSKEITVLIQSEEQDATQ